TRAHPLPEPVLGHSDYQADPAFAVCRAALLDRLLPALPRQRGVDEAAEQRGPGGGGSPGEGSPDGSAGQGSSGRSSG
ncbi:hypothetical protein AB0E83_33415, partial [Streptomyces sp. NPDC035033]|uniref:hypothetical protein n=1 Tax=Streptomyces sp. NPDC035033 TaxID=3155368 RepID=UPI0033C5E602